MSLNIPQDLVRLASAITAELDLGTLGPRQLAALKRYLRTGRITRSGVVADVAEAVLKEREAPYLQRTQYGLRWCHMPPATQQQIHEAIVAYWVSTRLTTSGPGAQWVEKHLATARKATIGHKGEAFVRIADLNKIEFTPEPVFLPATAITITLHQR